MRATGVRNHLCTVDGNVGPREYERFDWNRALRENSGWVPYTGSFGSD